MVAWTSCKSRFVREFTGKMQRPSAPQSRVADFVRDCAVEMHMDMSQKPFYARIYSKNAAKQMAYPGLNTYRKNPSVWTHCLRKNAAQLSLCYCVHRVHCVHCVHCPLCVHCVHVSREPDPGAASDSRRSAMDTSSFCLHQRRTKP